MKSWRASFLTAATALLVARAALAGVSNIDQFRMNAKSFAFERSSMNPIVRDTAGNWYLVVQLSDGGKFDLPGTVCDNNNVPCWLKWNSTASPPGWEEHAQPLFTGLLWSHCSGPSVNNPCEWYVDTESRNGRVVAVYLDKKEDDIFLFSFTEDNGAIDFSTKKVAQVTQDEATGTDVFGAVALDDHGCAYVLSRDSSSIMRMRHIDLVNNPEGDYVGIPMADPPYELNTDVAQDDGGDVIVVGTKAYTIYSDQECSVGSCVETNGETVSDTADDYFLKREHNVSTTPCANNWGTGEEIVNQEAFDLIEPTHPDVQRADGHVAMSTRAGIWYAVMKTSAPDDATYSGDSPILVLARQSDEDIYEIVDRNDIDVTMPLGGQGVSRPSLWMDPGNAPGFFVAYQDSQNSARNTAISRWWFLPSPDSNGNPQIIEWEKKHILSQNLWPRLVFSQCEDDTLPDCDPNEQINGNWKAAAWSSVRTGSASNFLMSVEQTPDPAPPAAPVDNKVITAQITRDDWGCADHYDNDGDASSSSGAADRDANDSGCPIGAGADLPEDAACSDGLDNDGDGAVDGNDPNCGGPWDNREAPNSCGLGFEAGLALMSITAARVLLRRPRESWGMNRSGRRHNVSLGFGGNRPEGETFGARSA